MNESTIKGRRGGGEIIKRVALESSFSLPREYETHPFSSVDNLSQAGPYAKIVCHEVVGSGLGSINVYKSSVPLAIFSPKPHKDRNGNGRTTFFGSEHTISSSDLVDQVVFAILGLFHLRFRTNSSNELHLA